MEPRGRPPEDDRSRPRSLPARRGVPDIRPRLAPSRTVARCVGARPRCVLAVGGYAAARETSVFAVRTLDVVGGTPRDPGAGARRARRRARAEPAARRRRRRSTGGSRPIPDVHRVPLRPRLPAHASGRRRARACRCSLLRRGSERVPRLGARPRHAHARRTRGSRRCRGSGCRRTRTSRSARAAAGAGGARGGRARAAARRVAPGAACAPCASGDDGADARARLGLELRLGDTGDLRLKLAIARRILRAAGAATDGAGYLDVSVPERPVLAAQLSSRRLRLRVSQVES